MNDPFNTASRTTEEERLYKQNYVWLFDKRRSPTSHISLAKKRKWWLEFLTFWLWRLRSHSDLKAIMLMANPDFQKESCSAMVGHSWGLCDNCRMNTTRSTYERIAVLMAGRRPTGSKTKISWWLNKKKRKKDENRKKEQGSSKLVGICTEFKLIIWAKLMTIRFYGKLVTNFI